MPGEFRAADGRLVAIVRYDRELIGEILLLDRPLNRAVREPIGVNRLQKEPALNEAIGIGRLFRRGGTRYCGKVII